MNAPAPAGARHLVLVRHGATDWTAAGRYQGWTDRPLSGDGRAQARLLAGHLAHERLDVVACSDLARAVETAAILAPAHAARATPGLRECNFGALEGLTHDEAVARHGERYARWVDDPAAHAPPGGEALAEFAARVQAAVDALPVGARALVVTHGGPIRLVLARALGVSLAAARAFALDPCRVTRVSLYERGAVVHGVNAPL